MQIFGLNVSSLLCFEDVVVMVTVPSVICEVIPMSKAEDCLKVSVCLSQSNPGAHKAVLKRRLT